ncbi:NAD(P)H-dependent oxidoreductase [Piscinibacter koreensis]|uniref:NAD(P)H-dependent oxidoreductase n=1 Tax=Piscinibacter koreensis TaxID=2742824 RepID=A0A7Y6TX96_9BURK|nr:NAD(P)H-dependent oxidoreductase [Schlegelella koreensis]NUZ06872.1 NAD(P)H-dependent oxidoreductase [Schlegelella koreensis]
MPVADPKPAATGLASAPEGAPTRGPRIVVLAAHPRLDQSRVNRQLMRAARGAGADGSVAVRDLYALYPDYLIDVNAEQAALESARLVVWLHPMQWYGMPPLLKLWLDEVLTLGWAYGQGGDALQGKDVWLVASTGGAESSYHPRGYNRYFFDAFLPPYEQSAVLCGMRFLPPLVLHGAHQASDATIAAHAATFADRLERYPDWDELQGLEACPACEVPPSERPHVNLADAA